MTGSRAQQILSDVIAAEPQSGSFDLPELLIEECVRALPLDGAGMWVMTDQGVQSLIAVTDGTARVLEDLQFSTGEGPCIDAFNSGRPVAEPDLAITAPSRWPGFGPPAVLAGVGAIFAFPLQLGRIRLGVLDLYRIKPGPLTKAETTEALAFTDAAAILLLYLQQQSSGPELHPQLDTAWTGRPEVHQASGMVSAQAEVSLAAALSLLRAHAFASSRPIRDIARDIVERELRFDAFEQEFVTADSGNR